MKRLLLLTILLVISFSSFSQEKETKEEKAKGSTFQGVKYGVRTGLTISNLDFDATPTMENKHRNSFYVGFFADIGLSKTISLVPEIQFSPEGAKAEVLHLDYIQIPILLRFRISEKIHFGLGPQVGLKVYKYEDGIQNFAYSGVAGIEYKLTHVLFTDVRYTYGISDIFDDAQGITAKNTNIQIGVGYKF
ncbi:porin family protein [Thalassobellus suaedae]|uniref:Porin family protein n=1 Tax=Thalassobellus suaedae TaxID=3074124 RepID=A0ABY9Y2Q3_9FLAO|nr:porin family protein [Flavobacteriaceae bacterium HL-DH10]